MSTLRATASPRSLPRARRVLDAGCGSGYGSAELGAYSPVVGIDVAADAVRHARESYGSSGICFVQAGCEAIPFADHSFDLVVAFEVIEHIEGWREMLRETRRVLTPAGLLLVSTPNRSYYAETRKSAGPNPYHVHEFEYEEFAAALREVFSGVSLWSQNHAEAIAFVPMSPAGGKLDCKGDENPRAAHFFLAVCGETVPPLEAFAWLPVAGNVLRERERHVQLLEGEVAQKTAWLDDATRAQEKLKREHDTVLTELEQHNAWAEKLNVEIGQARRIIARLEEEGRFNVDRLEAELRSRNQRAAEAIARLERELAEAHRQYGERVRQLEEEAALRLEWARDLEAQIARGNEEIRRRVEELQQTRAAFDERTRWGEEKAREALRACEIIDWQKAQTEALSARIDALERTRWLEFGRKLGVIPK